MIGLNHSIQGRLPPFKPEPRKVCQLSGLPLVQFCGVG